LPNDTINLFISKIILIFVMSVGKPGPLPSFHARRRRMRGCEKNLDIVKGEEVGCCVGWEADA
jgi:Trk-type K+ transport system membrane component